MLCVPQSCSEVCYCPMRALPIFRLPAFCFYFFLFLFASQTAIGHRVRLFPNYFRHLEFIEGRQSFFFFSFFFSLKKKTNFRISAPNLNFMCLTLIACLFFWFWFFLSIDRVALTKQQHSGRTNVRLRHESHLAVDDQTPRSSCSQTPPWVRQTQQNVSSSIRREWSRTFFALVSLSQSPSEVDEPR